MLRLRVEQTLYSSEDENRKLAKRWLVPEAQLERLGVDVG